MYKTLISKPSFPIGIFDSGMGGLTVLKELMLALPNESFIYLGDTARLPYGTKSKETVRRYAEQMASVLVEKKIKLLVVACNTATAAALPYLQKLLPQLPVLGVVEPGARAAVKATRTQCVAVLATEGTINSGIYQNTIASLNPNIKVMTQSCGLFVALAEEGCIDDDIVIAAARKYLQPILDHSTCDSVLLGCTHFPVLKPALQKVLGNKIAVVDSAAVTVNDVAKLLDDYQLANGTNPASLQFLVTDLPERFIRVGKTFLGREIAREQVQLVDGI